MLSFGVNKYLPWWHKVQFKWKWPGELVEAMKTVIPKQLDRWARVQPNAQRANGQLTGRNLLQQIGGVILSSSVTHPPCPFHIDSLCPWGAAKTTRQNTVAVWKRGAKKKRWSNEAWYRTSIRSVLYFSNTIGVFFVFCFFATTITWANAILNPSLLCEWS